MTTRDSQPNPSLSAALSALPSYEMPVQIAGDMRARLAEMLEEFQQPVFGEIMAAFRSDLSGLAEGLLTTEGDALGRHGHVLTALAGELGAMEISGRGRQIERDRDQGFAQDTAAMIVALLALLDERTSG